MKKIWIAAALAAASVLSSSCASNPMMGKKPADFYLVDQDKKVWSTQKLGNDTVLLDFWATWCVPCLKAVPDMNAFNDKYHDKVKLLGVAIDEGGWAAVAPTIKKAGITYPVAVALPQLSQAYGIEGIPALLVLKNGIVVKQLTGAHTLAELEADLKEYLN